MGVHRAKAVTGVLGGLALASVRLALQLDCWPVFVFCIRTFRNVFIFTPLVQLTFSIILQHHISELSKYF
jgi:hypothetical protein